VAGLINLELEEVSKMRSYLDGMVGQNKPPRIHILLSPSQKQLAQLHLDMGIKLSKLFLEHEKYAVILWDSK
jgi:hypothetical protein